jgi:hypothetical protein
MASIDSIPQARVVRKAGQLQPEPPAPKTRELGPLAEQLRGAAVVLIGLWPLTGVVLLMAGLLWIAGMSGQP